MTKILITISLIIYLTASMACDSNQYKWIKQNMNISERQYTAMTKYDYPMLLDNQDKLISNFIKQNGAWGTSIYPFLKHFLKPGYKVMNIGSQSGMQALFMSKIVGNKGKVFIFQPYSVSYNLIRKSSFLNLFQNIIILDNVAISNKFSKQYIIIANQNTSGARVYNESIYLQQKKKCEQRFKCSVEEIIVGRIDDLLPKDLQFDFALIDVQRLEIEVFDGMKQIIKRSPNLSIYVQWGFGLNDYQNIKLTKQILLFFYELKYLFYESFEQGDCQNFKFVKIETYQQLEKKGWIKDLFLIPSHIKLPQF